MLAFKDDNDGYYEFADNAPPAWYAHLTPIAIKPITPKTLAELKREAEQGELEAAKKLPLVKQLRRMSRADVLAAVDKAFPAGLQRDLIRQLAVVAWAGAVERDRNDG